MTLDAAHLQGLGGDLEVRSEVAGHQDEWLEAVRPGEARAAWSGRAVELDEEEGVALVADRE